MIFKRLFLFSYILLYTTVIYSQDCKSADQELNIVYKQILNKYASDTLFLSKLKRAQLAWIKYRDAHVQAHFPLDKGENAQEKYGTVYNQCECFDIEMLTRERIKYLQRWIEGSEEGDVCRGSVRN